MNILKTIENFQSDVRNVNEEIERFYIHLSTRPIKFTVADFFDINLESFSMVLF
jgi:7tm Chemosensory receptor